MVEETGEGEAFPSSQFEGFASGRRRQASGEELFRLKQIGRRLRQALLPEEAFGGGEAAS